MLRSRQPIFLTLLFPLGLVSAQQIFINNVQGYANLDSCAEMPLSTVVRDMYSDCGDQGHTTSYSCFCTASSSYMAGVISTAVLQQCPGSTADASSATAVFNAYCQLNATPNTSATATSTSVGASSSPATTSNRSNFGSSGLSSGAKAAIGVTVPVVVLCLILAMFIWLRKRAHQRRQEATTDHQSPETQWKSGDGGFKVPAGPSEEIGEVEGNPTWPSELPSLKEQYAYQYTIQELPATGPQKGMVDLQ
ncbi:hypothetical protein LTR93_010114 [Exophiala xenobiotica]|nr:hypothetical protein LTS06_009512 [Exophiala xenobiotica]KAK5315112.1 hypothetical protein LTR93_010114 [Exophiala xenobiotica]KAK5350033.1 hypothetical protein LTR61_006008 [Exophiala xenobiotica]KAK5409837.1 hypothetical protein LTR06_006303 [Exophiala xenobiotica]